MVVTASLARGAIRAAAEKQSRASAEARAQIKKVGFEPPATLRRFAEWFRMRRSANEKHALVIVSGKIGRRTGAFSMYLPEFEEIDKAWSLCISVVRFKFLPAKIQAIDQTVLSAKISGHALERMFQRTNTIEWAIIRDCLAGAALFLNAVANAYIESGCQKCAIPAEKGMLVGQVADGIIHLRTFLPDSDLNPRWQSLYDELLAFSARNTEAINRVALAPDDEAGRLFGELLMSGKCGWLFQPYVPGHDPLEDAWRSKE